jgi:hypothetical protein
MTPAIITAMVTTKRPFKSAARATWGRPWSMLRRPTLRSLQRQTTSAGDQAAQCTTAECSFSRRSKTQINAPTSNAMHNSISEAPMPGQ